MIVSLDNHELALDDAEGDWKAKDGKFNYKGVLDGVTTIQFVLDISKQAASWKIKLTKDDFWDEVEGSDGIDLRIIAGDYEGGLRLGVDQMTTLTFPKK